MLATLNAIGAEKLIDELVSNGEDQIEISNEVKAFKLHQTLLCNHPQYLIQTSNYLVHHLKKQNASLTVEVKKLDSVKNLFRKLENDFMLTSKNAHQKKTLGKFFNAFQTLYFSDDPNSQEPSEQDDGTPSWEKTIGSIAKLEQKIDEIGQEKRALQESNEGLRAEL